MKGLTCTFCVQPPICYHPGMKLADRIVADPETCSGHPRIEGTRVRVSHVLGWLASGMTRSEITTEYPYISEADIGAALQFAAHAVDATPVAAE